MAHTARSPNSRICAGSRTRPRGRCRRYGRRCFARSGTRMGVTTRLEAGDLEHEAGLLEAVRAAARDRVVYVCFSGGIDSTVVLAASVRAGLDTVALLGVSPSLAAAERADAHRIANEIGVRVEEVET